MERAVHRLPGRARPPLVPVKRSYTPGQQRYIERATTRYARGAARDRGYSVRGRGTAPLVRQIARYGTGRERRALDTYFRGNPRAVAQAKLFRQVVLADARRRGVGAVLGGRSVDLGPPGVRGWRSPRAVKALHRALLRGDLRYQANAGARIAHTALRSYDAAHPNVVREGPLSRAASFAFSPQHNAFAAVTSGLYKNSALFRDLFDLPANTVTSAYNTGAGVVEAIGGDSRRIRQLAQGTKEHDPLALLLQGKPGRALFEARTHPFTTALEVSGVAHGVGRAAEVPLGRKLPRGVAYRLPGTGIAGMRPFSGHAAVRVVQRATADRRMRAAEQLRRDAARANTHARVALAAGDHAGERRFRQQAQAGYAKAERVDPRRARTRDVQRWLDEHNAAVEDVRRSGRGRVMKAAEQATHGKHGAVQSLYLQGIIHLTKHDIEAYVKDLSDHATHLDGARLAANVELRHHLEKALADPNFKPREVKAAADAYRALVVPLQAELVRAGMLNRDAAVRAPLMGYAVRRMGARYAHGERIPASRARLAEIGSRLVVLSREFGDAVKAANRGGDPYGTGNWARAARIDAEIKALRDEGQNGASHTGLVGADGLPLSNDAIRAHMRDPAVGGGHVNPDGVIYLPQTPEARGAANYYRSFAQRETHRIGSQTRTGEAVRHGTFDAHPDTLVAHAANVQGLVDANQGFLDFYRRFGFRPHDPRAQGSYADMKQLAADIEAKTGRAMRPVRIQPWGESADRLTAMLDYAAETHLDAHGNEVSPVHAAIDRALDSQSSDPGPFGLVDAAAAGRLREHMKLVAPTTGARVRQIVNQAFRRTVLPFSLKWITGNVVEAGLRTAIHAHFNPVAIAADYRLMRRTLKAHDGFIDADVRAGRLSRIEADRAKAELRARAIGGGHFEMQVRTQLHRTAEQFRDTPFQRLAQVMGTAARTQPAKIALTGLRRYTDWMMHSVNGTIERQFQSAMGGRAMRVRMFDRKLPVVHQRAVDDFARGLRETPAQVELGRMVDRAYGKYAKFGPSMRQWVAEFTPFLAWTLNSIRFLGHTLPAEHPVLTALLAVNHEANHDWLLAHGLVVGQSENAVPDWLLGTVPVASGHVPAARYTPFGIAGGDAFGTLADLVFPQYSGFLKGLQGLDWKNAPVRGVDAREGRVALALKQFAESNIPIYSQVSAFTARKGDLGVKFQRQFNPFYPIQNTAQAQGGSSGTTSGGWVLPDSSQAPGPSAPTWVLPGRK